MARGKGKGNAGIVTNAPIKNRSSTLTKNLIISAICATALSASVAAADTTITSSFNSFTLETGGVTYTGAYAATVTS